MAISFSFTVGCGEDQSQASDGANEMEKEDKNESDIKFEFVDFQGSENSCAQDIEGCTEDDPIRWCEMGKHSNAVFIVQSAGYEGVFKPDINCDSSTYESNLRMCGETLNSEMFMGRFNVLDVVHERDNDISIEVGSEVKVVLDGAYGHCTGLIPDNFPSPPTHLMSMQKYGDRYFALHCYMIDIENSEKTTSADDLLTTDNVVENINEGISQGSCMRDGLQSTVAMCRSQKRMCDLIEVSR